MVAEQFIKELNKWIYQSARYVYAQIRSLYDEKEGKRLFENYDLYVKALNRKGYGTVILRTYDGLNITIRQNIWDARIVRETFFDKQYARYITLPQNPTIVDIGGYIGDFSIYAVKYFNARRVIVYEPTMENFKILKQNIENNHYSDRITAVNKAVSNLDYIILNVQSLNNDEIHASAYWYKGAERRQIQSTTLLDLFEIHQLDSVDLLKVDCEGGEYDIFLTVPDQLFNSVRNIIFEYHDINGFEKKLNCVLNRLKSAGYIIQKYKNIIYAYRI